MVKWISCLPSKQKFRVQILARAYAPIAQLVEQDPFKVKVLGSIPSGRTSKASVAQLAEQDSLKVKVVGSSPAGGILKMKKEFIKKIKKAHFIGIGGIGVSSIARMMILLRKKVSGSDIGQNEAIKKLKKSGTEIFIGHKESNFPDDADIVIYSPAISENNPELLKAKKLGVPVYSYPESLGLISKEKYTIAISGAHGKTTTTAMTANILIDAKKNPTVIVGSFLKKQNNNFILGKSKYFIVEACEYKESFLNLCPDILAITNIDKDHLDYYHSIANIRKAFAKMILKVPKNGFIVCNPDDKQVKITLDLVKKKSNKLPKIIDYTKQKNDFKLKVIGQHNILNAKIALTISEILKIKKSVAKKSLEKFQGTWRRFEYKGKTKNGALVYDDYAHHPKEIQVTLKTTREKFINNKIVVAFQPHLYSRTKELLKDFGKSFNDVDEIVITDIYAAREKMDKSIHAKDLARKIKSCGKNAIYISDFKEIEKYILKNSNKGDIIVIMGAGSIYQISEKLINY